MIVPHEGQGGCAFPQDATTGNLEEWRFGMSLRDYFAAKAMAAIASDTIRLLAHSGLKEAGPMVSGMIAHDSYTLADAMLAEREK